MTRTTRVQIRTAPGNTRQVDDAHRRPELADAPPVPNVSVVSKRP
jgi:hypothetical protein